MKDIYELLNNINLEEEDFVEMKVNDVERAKVKKDVMGKVKNKRKKGSIVVAASLAGIIAIGVASPAVASKIPFVGNVFESIEKNIYYPGNYSQYATKVNEAVYSNGIGITLSEILCDGQSIYATYVVESDTPFNYTSKGLGEKLDMNQLLIGESYNKASFTNKELDVSGFGGLEGKFIDEYTFIGVQKYKLSTLNLQEEIPSEFDFQTKIEYIHNYAVEEGKKDDVVYGTWAFKTPVKVNKELRKDVEVDKAENDDVKIDSISYTPFDMVVDLSYKIGNWDDYTVVIYDENGEELSLSETNPSEDKKSDKAIFMAPKYGSKSIKIVVEKPYYEPVEGEENVSVMVDKDIVFEQVIMLNK